ncbi:2-methylisocitrate lyase-like PEP mutase family enzyme [Novosphingobium kunmingense]|uniref:2-methylisocitrate lyase-like PEP mutase family enzyme n=1 Tax=Novosphingobium kunmingense TaxID=1211806 RepID=A0A2N0I1J3_9SPHN|nr:isocitrate lyase/phosphoenolpyruvate mutase family protein [Novosphingobium kunmingense]PKB25059.1 2-methylisocitrate lyase-like PEP mutase family enzyme [Novosphingobium kunmingense]
MNTKVDKFRALHVPGDPLILFNIWDAGSARAVAEAGAKAIATGSYGVAEAQGFKDGEEFPLDRALDVVAGILRVTDLPVTFDMESGYGDTAVAVGLSVARALKAGAAGINIEDHLPGQSALVPVAEQAARLRAAADTGIFVNARCDVYRGVKPDDYGPHLVDAVLERARAYADAGAGGLFVPFLGDHGAITKICAGSPLPVNVLWGPGRGTRDELAALGVARISYGHGPWAAAMAWLKDQAGAVFGGEVAPYAR